MSDELDRNRDELLDRAQANERDDEGFALAADVAGWSGLSALRELAALHVECAELRRRLAALEGRVAAALP